jgi:hypothetical protein
MASVLEFVAKLADDERDLSDEFEDQLKGAMVGSRMGLAGGRLKFLWFDKARNSAPGF